LREKHKVAIAMICSNCHAAHVNDVPEGA